MAILDLTGKGIGLTGGGGHLGRAMALGLAECGATVLICGRQLEPLEHVAKEAKRLSLAGQIVTHAADVRDSSAVETLLDLLQGKAGHIDGWVNNAYSGTHGALIGVTRDEIEITLSGGFTDSMMVFQAVARRMIPQGHGSIVNISSIYGMVSPQPSVYQAAPEFHNPPAYGAAKAALLQFTRYAACHLGPTGIRVNAISPGPFPSPEVQHNTVFVRALTDRVPLRRIGQPAELVGAVAFLLSDSSSYVTGINLPVDGGWTAW